MAELATPFPSALPPTEAELVAWRALSRDEQITRYRAAVQAPDAGRVNQSNMVDVMITARQRVASHRA